MLYSDKLLIAMPTKTGSRTITKQAGDFRYISPWHAVIPPAVAETQAKDIIMMVREPHARLVSAWAYHQRNPEDWNIPGREKEMVRTLELRGFIRWLADKRRAALRMDKNPLVIDGMDTSPRPWKWVLSLNEHEQCAIRAGYSVLPWRLEGIQNLPAYVKDRYGLTLGPFEKRLNDSSKWLGKERQDPREMFTEEMTRWAEAWLRDGKVYGYGAS